MKSLASKPQFHENCPVLGSRTALFLNRGNFVGKRQKPCGKSAKTFFLVSSSRDRLKKNLWRPFFLRTLASVSLVLGLERVCPWPWNFFVSLAMASSLVSSTPRLILVTYKTRHCNNQYIQYINIIINIVGSVAEWVKALFLRRPWSNGPGSTCTLVTLLRPWIRRFTMIISAWWLRTSSEFSGQEFEEIHRNIGLSETPKLVQIPPITK